ncbi:MAG TPA: hypothetical protein VMW52_05570 [Phycisphaerae bacterium]|nr:hypothetical protein [Phycisphaerae bacterium]
MKQAIAKLIFCASLAVVGACLLGPAAAEAIRLPIERLCRTLDDAARFVRRR